MLPSLQISPVASNKSQGSGAENDVSKYLQGSLLHAKLESALQRNQSFGCFFSLSVGNEMNANINTISVGELMYL